MSNFWDAINQVEPIVIEPIEYRLYYDKESGEALFFTTEKQDGDFLVVSEDIFKTMRVNRYRVYNEILYELDLRPKCTLHLTQTKKGEYCTIKNNMIFVADEGDNYTERIELHEVGSHRK